MKRVRLIVFVVISVLILAGASGASVSADQSEKATGGATPTPLVKKDEHEKKVADATEKAKELLLLMDTNKNGKVSKQEWMKFMETEFDRLDVKHDGELDVKELKQSQMRYRPAIGK